MASGKGGAQRPGLTDLSHMTFYAHDMDQSIHFYRNFLGYEDVTVRKGPGGAPERVFIDINELQYVELVPEVQPNTGRLVGYGFVTDDAEAMRTYLLSRGVEAGKVAVGPRGNRSLAVRDPDGHELRFVERHAGVRPRGSAPDLADDRISRCLMHIGFTCFSLDASMAFYRDILGCAEMWRGSRDKKILSWVQLRLPESINYIEFMLYDTFPSLDRLGVLDHYGLEVPNMPDAKGLLEGRRGYTGYTRPLDNVIGACHHRLMNAFDPDGSRAELMERATYDGLPRPSRTEPPPR
jgi:catechol 2,3-dioxygenase-like lactoylglutathione lyase family enzyme